MSARGAPRLAACVCACIAAFSGAACKERLPERPVGPTPSPLPPIAAEDYEIVRRSRPAPDAVQLWVVVHRSMTQRELVQLTRDLSTWNGLRLTLFDVYTSTDAYDACQGVAQHDLHTVRSQDPQYLEYGKTCTRGTLLSAMERKGQLRLQWYGPMFGQPDVLLAAATR